MKNDMKQYEKVKSVFMHEKEKALRFHYDGFHVLDKGKMIEILVITSDGQHGNIVLPWEEIVCIRKFGWEQQDVAAQKVMKGKRVHCHHLKSWHFLFLPVVR